MFSTDVLHEIIIIILLTIALVIIIGVVLNKE